MSVHACDGVDSVDACESTSQSQSVVVHEHCTSCLPFILHTRMSFLLDSHVRFCRRNEPQSGYIRCERVCVLLVLSASLVLCVCVRENESYLAVEHLITCHVIQLHSVQVISTEHTTQQISLYHYFPLIHFRIKLTNKCALCVSLCECMSCVAQNSSLLHKCLNESTHVVVVVVCCLRKKFFYQRSISATWLCFCE